ncbi:VOC family protein [Nocardioides taihuensis]|uniref:VOC family protein n=1 Tax=Nocardioides taihuensis TaxID=1835606 RepID=A0ABW0BI21_9ACTN
MLVAGFSHVALTVSNMKVSREFYSETLGLTVLDSSDSYCALLIGGGSLSALILTHHEDGVPEPFSELRPGLDHVSLAVRDLPLLTDWQTRLTQWGVHSDLRRSEWGHHLNFRDPDNIALELVVIEPDAQVQQVLDQAGLV